jgi:elongation factor 1-alpha
MADFLEDEITDILNLDIEDDEGSIEYKRSLLSKDENRLEELATQMRYRIEEGKGECRYIIGADDDGSLYGLNDDEYAETIEALTKVSEKNDYSIRLLQTTDYKGKKVSEFLVRENNIIGYSEIRVAIAGNVDSGKSSSIGTLITGRQDDGRGSARTYVLKYDHELKTGRTSSVSQQIIGYDPEGKVVNHDSEVKNITWPDIVKRSSKIITFFDLCGHTKYAKTTISGIVSSSIDYAVVTVGANMGARGNTLEHIRICLTFKIPVIILLTKMDLVKDKPDMLKENLANIKRLFNAPGSRKKCMLIKEIGDVLNIVDHIKTGSIVPIFKISNIDLSGHDLVHEFFNLLQPRVQFEKEGPVEYHIDTTFTVHGIGTVLGGMLKKGRVVFGKEYYVGPFRDNSYKKAKVRSIHVKRTLVSEVDSGRYVCLATPKLERDSIERGMVLLESPGPSIRKFKAEVIVFKTHHTTIKVGYRTTMNVNSLRTTIELMSILTKKKTSLKKSSEQVKEGSESPGVLRLGDRAMIVIKSLFRPVYVSVGDRFSMSEGKVKVTGIVREIL